MCAAPARISNKTDFTSYAATHQGPKGMWKELPPDPLCKVMSCLKTTELNTVSKIDQKWRFSALNPVNHEIACNEFLKAQTVIADIAKLQQTVLERFGQNLSFDQIIKKCSNLEELTLQHLYIDDAGFAEIAEACPASLKSLDCSFTQLQTPNFSSFKNLRELYLINCRKLQNLDMSSLVNLEFLITNACYELHNLAFNPLGRLKRLSLQFCTGLQGFDLRPLVNLEMLDLSDCTGLQNLDFTGLAKLNDLRLCKTRLQNLDFSPLVNLQILLLSSCSEIQNPNFSPLVNLEKLHLDHCTNLQNPNFTSLSNLQTLLLSHCTDLQNPDVSPLGNLQLLDLQGCTELQNPNFGSLMNLQEMILTNCPNHIRNRVFTAEEIPAECQIRRVKSLYD